MAQVNIKKSSNFNPPPASFLGVGFDDLGNLCIVNSDGSKTIIDLAAVGSVNIIANLGVGLESDLPEIFVQDDIYVTTDTHLKYVAVDAVTWEAVELVNNQFVTDSSFIETGKLLYQFIDDELVVISGNQLITIAIGDWVDGEFDRSATKMHNLKTDLLNFRIFKVNLANKECIEQSCSFVLTDENITINSTEVLTDENVLVYLTV